MDNMTNTSTKKTSILKSEFYRKDNQGYIKVREAFNFSFTIKNENTLNYSYYIHPDKAASVLEVLEICILCQGLLSGKIKYNGKIIAEYTSTTKNKRDEKSLEYLTKYWTKVYQLEKLLKCTFSPAEIIKNFEKESFNFARLERSLIDKEPYRIDDFVLNEINLTAPNEDFINKLKDKNTHDFGLREKELISFAGQDFKLYKIKALFSVIIKDITILKTESTGIPVKMLVDCNNDDMYLSEQIFLTERESKIAFNDENLEKLRKARPL